MEMYVLSKNRGIIFLESCCNGCYNKTAVRFDDLNELECLRELRFFNLDFCDSYGYEDVLKIIYQDNEEILVKKFTKYYDGSDC